MKENKANMAAENQPPAFEHIPVLLEECLEGLDITPNGIYIDGTVGGAGHSYEIAKRLDKGKLIAVDKDIAAIQTAGERLQKFPGVELVQGDFREIPQILDSLDIPYVDGILLDLGVSSHQLDTPERGFSYHHEAPLDMRMSGRGMSAYDVVNTYEVRDLIRIFREYGEERFAGRVANGIARERERAPIETTLELAEIIKENIPAAARRTGGHPAKRVFQAIRIEVNGELESLEKCLETAFYRLSIGGRFAIITFHSLEDRLVKRAFAKLSTGCTCPPDFPICVCGKEPQAELINRRPITASEQELEVNNRSRSAKLRILKRIDDRSGKARTREGDY